MNRILLLLSALAAGALLIPDIAEAQRGGGRGGGGFGGGRGAGIGGGGFGGGGAFRGGGSFRGGSVGGGPRMYIPQRGSGFRGGPIAAQPGGVPGRMAGISPRAGGFRQVATNNPSGRFDNRLGNRSDYFGNRNDWRYGVRAPGSWGGRYPNYGGRYPYYGRYYGGYPYYGGWGLATGAVIGAAATYPYYDYPYSTYQTPVASADGGYCVTSVRSCALTSSAPVGTGCSCRIPGGRARGTVQ